MDQQQFAFDGYALGKILYELIAGIPLPAFVSHLDSDYDLAKNATGSVYRGINRVLRGLLHDDPAIRMVYLRELPGQIEEFISLVASETPTAITPQWHTDLLTASDLLAAKVAISAPKSGIDDLKKDAEQIAQETLDVWEASGAVKQLQDAFGVDRGGQLNVSKPVVGDTMRSLLGGLQPTRKGLEPLEDKGYPHKPTAEAGCHMTVSSADAERVPFRQVWLTTLIAVKDKKIGAAVCIVRREEGVRGTTDILGERIWVLSGVQHEAGLVTKVRAAAQEMLQLFVQDVINEVKRVAKP